MKYVLEKSSNKNIDYIKKCKLKSILDYAVNLSDDEINKINNYVDEFIIKQIKDYKIIKIDNKIIGCLLVETKDDGVLLNEIYIEEDYRNKKIGSSLIKSILKDNNFVYLWVYKLNEKAIKLYKKLGFEIIEETTNRYYMKYSK